MQLPAHDHRPVAREIRKVVEPCVSLAVKLLDGHIVLEAPADKRLDERAGTAEEQLLERAQHARAHRRVPVPDVWQHRFEELHRERLHLLRAVAVRLHEGHEHLDSDDCEQLAQSLDHVWVLVAAAAQCDRAALA